MNEVGTVSERMLMYLKKQGTTPTAFEKRMGWSSAYIKNTKNPGIDKVIAFKHQFPLLNLDWLATGFGAMEKNTNEEVEEVEEVEVEEVPKISTTKGQPYYNVDFQGGFDIVLNDQTVNPDFLIDFAPYNKEGVVWCNATGQSMHPDIKHGSMIALMPIVDWYEFIPFGEIYAIITRNGLRTIKKIQKGSDDSSYTLVPSNKEYEPQPIKKSMITHVFAVIGVTNRLL